MGNVGTSLARHALHRLRRFNIDNRAHKVLDAKKPQRAPTYKVNLLEAGKLAKEHPEIKEELNQKNEMLLKNLQSVYVTSKDEVYSKRKALGSPQDNLETYRVDNDLDTTYKSNTYTATYMMDAIKEYKNNPNPALIPTLSEKYKINKETLDNIFTYIKIFDMYLPPAQKKPSYLESLAKEAMPIMENIVAKEKSRYEFITLQHKRMAENKYAREHAKKSKETTETNDKDQLKISEKEITEKNGTTHR